MSQTVKYARNTARRYIKESSNPDRIHYGLNIPHRMPPKWFKGNSTPVNLWVNRWAVYVAE